MNEISTTNKGIPGAEWLTPATMQQGMDLANLMAECTLVPDYLKKKPGDCFPILVQALRWKMDPFAVAQCTAVVRGKLCYEGKLVHAVLVSMGAIEGRLSFEYDGAGDSRGITVTGTPKGDHPRSITGTVRAWQTDNGNWKRDPDMMLAYRGTRAWARLYCPDAMLGVYTPDEASEIEPREVDAVVHPAAPEAARTGATGQARTAATIEPAADKPVVVKAAIHPAIAAANSLWTTLEQKNGKGTATPIIVRLCKLYGADAPKNLAHAVLDAFAKDIEELARDPEPTRIDDLLHGWETAAKGAKS